MARGWRPPLILVAFLALAALGALLAGAAQGAPWASPGTGTTFDMNLLQSSAGGSVDTISAPCHYRMDDTITISATDTLVIDAGCWLEFDANQNLTILGRLLVNGTGASPVLFEVNDNTPVEGEWDGVTFAGVAFAPSSVQNLSIQYSTFGLRCLGCQNLTVANLSVTLNSGDGILVLGNAWNLSFWDISVAITTYTSQSPIGISRATNVTGGRVSATGTLSVLTLWNISNVSFEGPLTGSGIRRFAAWLDNATNLTLSGLTGTSYPAGVLLTRSSNVTLFDIDLSTTSAPILGAAQVDRLTLTNLSGTASSGSAVLASNLTNSTMDRVSVTGTRYVIALSDSRFVAVVNATAVGAGPAFSANRTTSLWVNDSSFQGGNPAAVNLNASSAVFLRNVGATGSAAGFLVSGGSGVLINDSSAVGNLGPGARFLNSSRGGLARTQLSSNIGGGLALVNASNFTLDACNLASNTGAGLSASASTLSVAVSNISGNGEEGVVLTNGTRLDSVALVVESNGRDGLWARGGSLNLTGATVRLNGLNGTRAEGASLNLTDGVFERNGRYGVFFSANATGSWTVATTAWLAHNPAVLSGAVLVPGGYLQLLNATVDLQDAPATPFLFDVSASGTLALDTAVLRAAGPSSKFTVQLASGAFLSGASSRLESPGRGVLASVAGSSCQVDLADVQVIDSFAPFELSACVVRLTDVSFTGARADVLSLTLGSSLDALRLTIDGAAGSGVLVNGSSADIRSSLLSNVGWDALFGSGADMNLTDSVIAGAFNRGIALEGGRLSALNTSVEGGSRGIEGLDAVLVGDLLRISATGGTGLSVTGSCSVDLSDSTIDSAAGNGLFALVTGPLVLSNVTVDAGVTALVAFQAPSIVVSNSTLTGGLWGGDLGPVDDFDLTDSGVKGTAGGLRVGGAGNLSLTRVSLSGVSGPALWALGAASITGLTVDLSGGDTAASLDQVPTVSITGFTIVTTLAVSTQGVRIANATSVSLTLGSLAGAGAGVGLLIENASGVALQNLDMNGSAFQTAVAFVDVSSVSLSDASVRAGLTGLSLANVTGLAVTNLTVAVLDAGVSVWASALSQATFDGLAASGGATGVSLTASSSVRISNATLSNLTASGVAALSTSSLTLSDLTVASGAFGVSLRACPGARLERLLITATTTAGVLANTSDNLRVVGATVRPVSGAGFNISSSGGAWLEGVRVEGGSDAIRLSSSGGFWSGNLTVEGSAVGLAAYSLSSANLTGARLLNLTKTGISASNGSVVTLWNSVVAGAPAPPFLAVNASRGALVRFYDSAADNSTFRSDPAGQAEVWWSLRVLVLRDGAPLGGSNVTLRNRSGALAAALLTDGQGFTPTLFVLEFVDANGTRAYASPHAAAVVAGSGFEGAVTFDHSQAQTVTVNVRDGQPPFLEDRVNERTRRGDGFVFQQAFGDNDNVGIVRMEWSFVNETGVLTTRTGNPAAGFRTTYTFSKAGRFEVTLRAFDLRGNSATLLYNVSVNHPPYFLRFPAPTELYGLVGLTFSLSFDVSDNDTEDIPGLAFTIDGPPGASMVGHELVWTPALTGRPSFTVSVFDGRDYTRWPFDVLIGQQPDEENQPPVFESQPVTAADILHAYSYEIVVSDPDGTRLTLQLIEGPANMSLVYSEGSLRGTLRWNPIDSYPDRSTEWERNFSISLRVFDFQNFTYQNFTLHLQNPPDIEPSILPIPDLRLGPGDLLTLDLAQFATDVDDPDPATMSWSIGPGNSMEGAEVSLDGASRRLVVRAPPTIDGTHIFYLTIIVKDPAGKSNSTTVRIELKGPTVFETAFPWLLLLGIVAAAGGAYALVTRQRASAMIDEAAARPVSAPKGGAPVGPASDAPFPVYIEGVLLFDHSENLIASKTVEGANLDDVFVLLPAQVRDKVAAEGSLVIASVDSRDVAIYKEGDGLLAAVGRFAGEPSPWLLDPMKSTLSQIQGRAEELNLDSLEKLSDDTAVAQALGALLAVSAGSSPEAVAKFARETSLRVASVVEHVEGLLRLKVAVDNNSSQLAADVRLSLDFDEKVLRLERMEPAFEQRRDRIHLGNLRPGERKTVAFYFDPQVCTRSFINATAGWEDALGEFHSASMRTRAAEVVCPAFSTVGQANTAMLRRLLQEELAFRDSKYFRMGAAASPHEVFEACKAAVLAQDVRLVKQFEVERPYRAEAWFYGETKVQSSPMVIWTSVFGQEKVAQFSAASNAQASITGLLAELGRRLQESKPGGKPGPALEAMGKAQAAAQVGSRATLFSKTDQGEAKPKDE